LKKNYASDLSAKILSEALLKPGINVVSVNLSYNLISNAGGELLGEAVEVNKTLRTLSLKCNNLKEETGEAFMKAMKCNKCVTKLDLSKN
jgi:Ran GTPase-activating protein (RanGAP) involved in mRNA processing and transport